MKKFVAQILIGTTLTTTTYAVDNSLRAEVEALKVQIAELKEAQSKINYDALKKQLLEVKAHDAHDDIKWNVDFRTAYDVLDYKIATGTAMVTDGSGGFTPTPVTKGKVSNSVWTNKLYLKMAAQPVDNLVFRGALAVYSTFGQNNLSSNSMFQSFDWYGTQKPNNSIIKLREAYFLYFGNMSKIPYTVSFGRRPSVNGFMTNLREDNKHVASPIGHNINMGFDGASFKFNFENLTGISGLYAKICIGRGFSNSVGSYSNNGAGGFNPPYKKDSDNPNMDLIGLLARLYDDGQYKVMASYFQGYNMMGMDPTYTPTATKPAKFIDVGDMNGWSLSLQVDGIGDAINDFLDDTIFFASYASMQTKPNDASKNVMLPLAYSFMKGMLGSTENEIGYSYYVGLNLPAFMEDDRIGLEYNHGSKYWRSFTYGEDTLAGSKLATRGDAYEAYYNLPLINRNFTAQLRYTYMDYDYTGSNAFFGMSGRPTNVENYSRCNKIGTRYPCLFKI